MIKLFLVGGTFDQEGGRPSKLIYNVHQEFMKDKDFVTTCANGGPVIGLHDVVLPSETYP
jgi:hypothetical protein